MVKVATRVPKIELNFTLTVTEGELRALDALAGYGVDEFIKAFYTNLGKAYLEPHESDLRLFLKTLWKVCPGLIAKADEAHKAINAIGADATAPRVKL